jgi:arylsulfatase
MQIARTLLLLVLFTVLSLASATVAADRPPNIIYIMADDLGYNELGCYGQKKIETPNIDRLASQGMRFTQHYTSAPVCAPARCSLMTGKHAGHALVRTNYANHPKEYAFGDQFGGQYPLTKGTVTIGSMLKEAGYACGAFGKWGLGGVGTSGDPLKQGFDRFFGFNCQSHAHNLYPRYLVDDDKQRFLAGNTRGLTGKTYGPQEIADEMLAYIRSNKDKSFFVYYPTVIPHLALQAPEKNIAHYRGRWPETPYKKGRSYLPHPTPKACYAAMITFMDTQVGRMLKLLDELELAENTVIMFTSDNGATHLNLQADVKFFESVGPLRGLKGSVYEGGIREPLIVRWPGRIKPGTVSDLVSAHYDAMPTLAEIAGVKPPKETDGISYLPTLLGKPDQQKQHAHLFWDFAGYGGQLAIRMGRWKGVKQKVAKNPDTPLELYDLDTDIGEKTNVAAKYPEVVAKIERLLLDDREKPVVERFRFGRYRD